ncbi:YtpR family tRNA-binding protein [Bacillus kwashiorkori]|uniref:YtpR family tRNA-binding protein n=1 Tax=Bacillus kwashiorkori TaxID=1522318 RepID=UPI00078085D8|nr:DUF4479 family protein [Bacillus kwashiorkori]
MNVFYNKEGVGDTLLISLLSENVSELKYEKQNDIVKILDDQSNTLVGYNIFHASKYFQLDNYNGPIDLTEGFLNDINHVLTENGLEALEVDLSPKFVVGFVEEKAKHPNADKLSICLVDVGTEKLQIVCGAPNVDAGQKVVVAKVGAVMPSGLVIKPAELRGVPSKGMICSARELELPNAPQEKGILVLEEHYPVGTEFKF